MTDTVEKGERIAKVMARAGLCSRRDAERWIEAGRVTVNGARLDTPATLVTAADQVMVDGEPLPEAAEPRLWRYNKPRGELTTQRDPEGRRTIFDSLPPDLPRVLSVGRLDINSEGLLLLTNDGALKRRMELPATGWTRRYRVRVYGEVTEALLDRLRAGMTVEGFTYAPAEVQIEHKGLSNSWLQIGLKEGKNREIRRLCEAVGLVVNRLIRVAYGPFQLGNLEAGGTKEVPAKIVAEQLGLKNAKPPGAGFAKARKPAKRPPSRKGTRAEGGKSHANRRRPS